MIGGTIWNLAGLLSALKAYAMILDTICEKSQNSLTDQTKKCKKPDKLLPSFRPYQVPTFYTLKQVPKKFLGDMYFFLLN